MSQVNENKEFINKAKKLFHEKGYAVKQSELYEIFSQLAGYKDWNTAVAKNVPLAKTIVNYVKENKNLSIDSFLIYVKDTLVNEENKEEKIVVKDITMPSWNYYIVGDPDSGKSVFLNKLIYSYFKQIKNPSLYILTEDIDGYNVELMNKNLNTKVIILGKELPMINLFDIDLNLAYPNKEKTEQIVSQLLQDKNNTLKKEVLYLKVEEYFNHLSLGSNKQELQMDIFKDYSNLDNILEIKIGEAIPNKEQIKNICFILEEIIKDHSNLESYTRQIYESVGSKHKRLPVLEDFRTYLSSKQENLQDFDVFIDKYPLFDKETEIDFNQSMIVDFKSLDINPKLKNIYTLLFEEKIRNVVRRIPKKDKMIVRDELNFGNRKIKECLIDSLRTSRVSNCVTVTMSIFNWINDVESCVDSRSILSSMNKTFIFKTCSSKTITRIGSVYGLNELMYPMLSKQLMSLGVLKKGDKKFSRFATIRGGSFNVYENRLNEEESVLFLNT